MHSTAISDLALVIGTLYFTPRLFRTGKADAKIAVIAFCMIAFAAFLGMFFWQISGFLAPVYRFSSSFAGKVAIPLLALCFLSVSVKRIEQMPLLALVLVVLFVMFEYLFAIASYRILIGGLSMLAIIYSGYNWLGKNRNTALFAIGGAVLTLLAGLAVGTQGNVGFILRIDLFHYLLALANASLGYSLWMMMK